MKYSKGICNKTEMSSVSLLQLAKLLKQQNTSAEHEFVHRISNNAKLEVQYFLNEYSIPMLNSIGKDIHADITIDTSGRVSYYQSLMAPYYFFISARDLKWHKLCLFKNKNDASLASYLSCITSRFFRNEKMKEDNNSINKKSISVQENEDVAILLEQREDIDETIDPTLLSLALKAKDRLPDERDRKVIELLIMDDTDTLDAFEELSAYIAPKKSPPIKDWDNKRKQNAVSLLKLRAKEHLRIEFQKLLKEENI